MTPATVALVHPPHQPPPVATVVAVLLVYPLSLLVLNSNMLYVLYTSPTSSPSSIVGGIMALCVNRLYPPVLTLRPDHCHYKPGILLLACVFDQNPFSTSPQICQECGDFCLFWQAAGWGVPSWCESWKAS